MSISFEEYRKFDATGLAQLVRQGDTSAGELLDIAWNRIRDVNDIINAVCWQDKDLGHEALGGVNPSAPFAGVPFLLKDGGASAKGLRLTFGSRSAKNYFPTRDGELTTRYRKAGLVIFGRTTSPEYGINVTCEGSIYSGPTRNPWNLEYSAGGSSSGAAAAVAAGIVPMAHGSDGGGSLRIPASCCGLFTLKVTRARLPHGPGYGESWSGMGASHVISRSVRDCALALDHTHGPDRGAPYSVANPAQTFLSSLAKVSSPLRIGYTLTCPNGIKVHPECAEAVMKTVSACEALGHIVSEADNIDIDFEKFGETMRSLVCANTANEMETMAQTLGVPIEPSQFELATWSAYEIGNALSASDYLKALNSMHKLGRSITEYVTKYDLILTPTLAELPPLLNRFLMNRDYVTHRKDTLDFSPFTPLANVSGQPAISVPAFWSKSGLPIGVQFIGHYGEESVLLSLAAQLETIIPWKDRLPAQI